MYFESGEKVTIRDDLNTSRKYYNEDCEFGLLASTSMLNYAGQEFTIEYVGEETYSLYEIPFLFTDEMFIEYLRYNKDSHEKSYLGFDFDNTIEIASTTAKEPSYHQLEFGASAIGAETGKIIESLEKWNCENLMDKMLKDGTFTTNKEEFEKIVELYNSL